MTFDQFATNLRAVGAYVPEGGSEGACWDDPYGDGYYDGCYDPETDTYYCGEEDYGMYACSLGGGAGGSAPAGLALIVLAMVLAVRPRRARSK